MKKFFSRKLIVTLFGIGAIVASGPLSLPPVAIGAIGAIVAAYVGGQGYVDGKRLPANINEGPVSE